jgi:hypothetical protein
VAISRIRIPERFRRYETLEDYVREMFFRVPAGAVETLGPNLGEPMPGDMAPWGYICTETHGQADKEGFGIVATYKKVKLLTWLGTGLSYYLPEIRRIGPCAAARGRHYGFRTFLADDSYFLQGADRLVKTYLPPYSGWSGGGNLKATVTGVKDGADTIITGTGTSFHQDLVGLSMVITDVDTFPITVVYGENSLKVTGDATCSNKTFSVPGELVVQDVRLDRNWRVGLARITVRYDTLSGWPALEKTPGTGILEIDVGSVSERLVYDLTTPTSQLISGEWWSGANHYRYIPISGSPTTLRPTCTLRVRVVLLSPSVATLMSLVGKINKNDCPNLGNAGEKTLWMYRIRLQPSRNLAYAWLAEIYLGYKPDGWDKFCVVEKQEEYIQEVEIKNSSGNSFSPPKYQARASWKSLEEPVFECRKVIGEADFSTINGYV